MKHSDIKKSDPRRLTEILGQFSGSSSSGCWDSKVSGAILLHQLAAPLRSVMSNVQALSTYPPTAEAHMLAELFAQDDPSTPHLVQVKEWAKARGDVTDGSPPREVAIVIYLASIIVARVKNRERISELADDHQAQCRLGPRSSLGS